MSWEDDGEFVRDRFETKLTIIRFEDPFAVKLMTSILKRYGYKPEPPTKRRKYSVQVRISDYDYEMDVSPTYQAVASRLIPLFHGVIDAVAAVIEDENELSDEELIKFVFES